MKVHERIALLQWTLPFFIAVIVILYQTFLVDAVHDWQGHEGHYVVEIIFYGVAGPFVTFFVLKWIRIWLVQKDQAEAKLRDHEIKLANFRLEEGKRVAGNLHREILPNLAYAANKIDLTRNQCSRASSLPVRADEELRNVSGTLRDSIRELRAKIGLLREGLSLESLPDEPEFFSALRNYLDEFADVNSINTSFSVVEPAIQVSVELERSIWLILKEALNNVAQHSKASNLVIEINTSSAGQVKLSISDNGIGFDLAQLRGSEGFGLLHIKEEIDRWGGTLKIDSEAGHGMSIDAKLPSQANRSSSRYTELTSK